MAMDSKKSSGKLKKMRKPEEQQMDMELEFEAPEADEEMELDLEMEPAEDEADLEMAEAGEDPAELADKLEEMGFDVSNLRAQIEEEKPEPEDDEEDLDIAEPKAMW